MLRILKSRTEEFEGVENSSDGVCNLCSKLLLKAPVISTNFQFHTNWTFRQLSIEFGVVDKCLLLGKLDLFERATFHILMPWVNGRTVLKESANFSGGQQLCIN